ncbi:hypothetical protein GcM3_071027 [Golovinomyces cichoracearum]|uniref:Uncharacterized protein n=1 Tax=Golovinomyces cichoracearum TaxID=62708 RepID=A0A420ISI3_9PEZI|nr:hypothetical protein GcM3_071027 [Golovinomyces cichoracearum]
MANRTLPLEISCLERHIDTKLLDAPKLNPASESANSVILHTFIARKLRWYVEINYMGGQLWGNYQDDFEDWLIDMFKDCEKEVIQCLRDTLARRGVHIQREKKKLYKWTKEEIKTQIEYGGGLLGN